MPNLNVLELVKLLAINLVVVVHLTTPCDNILVAKRVGWSIV